MDVMESVVKLCKARGFIFQNAGIYGGLANAWDYGPLGAELKKRLRDHWWNFFVRSQSNIFAMDSCIMTLPKVLEASGHVEKFGDSFVDCRSCQARFRLDGLFSAETWQALQHNFKQCDIFLQECDVLLQEKAISCFNCSAKDWTKAKTFNLMFETIQGATNNKNSRVYLRPETAQGIFVHFKEICRAMRVKLPFGVAQMGKAFRNEITTGHFIFRTREFEQMELEYFSRPADWRQSFDGFLERMRVWFASVGLKGDSIRVREHSKTELAHYSGKTVDFEYCFPFGWGEIAGLSHRGDFDLKAHSKMSLETLNYGDSGNDVFFPHVVEPSFGLDRIVLALLTEKSDIEDLGAKGSRFVLRLPVHLAPVQVAVLPLKKNRSALTNRAKKLKDRLLRDGFCVHYDDTGSIGKLYRRQDEAGVPWSVTVDFDTEIDGTVTVRDRDSMSQCRVQEGGLKQWFLDKIWGSENENNK